MNPETIKPVLTECIEAAGVVMRKYFRKMQLGDVETKSDDFDLVTVADKECEQAVIEIIDKNFPDHSIVCEEGGTREITGAEVCWYVDPIDGTTNYAHGMPQCCVSIAVEIKGELTLGAVYNPFVNECFEAEKGKGATLNGNPIHVSNNETLNKSLLVTGFPYDRRERSAHYLHQYSEFMKCSHGILRLGSAALDLCQVACGRLDGYYEESLNMYDWAAGMLIVSEAGGKVTDYSGELKVHECKQLLASNSLIHQEMIDILKPTVT